MKTLCTACCTLEPLVVTHAPEMFLVLSDPAIYEFENEPPVSVEWLARRYEYLEGRESPDGKEQWLNWVIQLPDGALAGCVQATALAGGKSYVAYELNSRYWRQGIGSSAVRAVLAELRSNYGVHTFVAVLKTANYRSMAFLQQLGFSPASQQQVAEFKPEADERVMVKTVDPP
jgi:ribosomal-protein-alanine N-acetyltransferase